MFIVGITRKCKKMTCKDCIYYNSISALCDKYIYPEERQDKTCEHFTTTCKNCKYFNKDKHPKMIGEDSLSQTIQSKYGYCERRVADGYEEYPSPDCEICNLFECVGCVGCVG